MVGIDSNSLSALKSFRLLRILRPLRAVRRLPSLRMVVDCTFNALPAIKWIMVLGKDEHSFTPDLNLSRFVTETTHAIIREISARRKRMSDLASSSQYPMGYNSSNAVLCVSRSRFLRRRGLFPRSMCISHNNCLR